MPTTPEMTTVSNITKANPPQELGVQELTKAVCVEKLRTLEAKAQEEVNQVKGRYARMRFTNNAIRVINSIEGDKNGEIDLEKHDALKKMKEDISTMEYEIPFLETEAETLEKEAEEMLNQTDNNDADMKQVKKAAEAKKEKAKAKRDEAAELKDIQEAMKILADVKKLTKEQKTKLVENCRSCFDDLNNINQLQLQSSKRLNDERHEALLLARMIIKTIHDDIVHKAKAMGGR